MKRLSIAIIFAMIIGIISSHAQVKWNVAAKAGATEISFLPGHSSNVFHWAAGGGAVIPLSRMFSVRPSLLATQRGSNITGYYGDEQILPAEYKIRTTYIELPVYFAVQFNLNENLDCIFKTGPSFAYGLNAKTSVKASDSDFKYTFPGNLFNGSCDLNNCAYDKNQKRFELPKFNRFDFLWGFGVDFMIRKHWIIGFDTQVGLTNVAEDFSDTTIPELIAKMFTFGYIHRNISIDVSFAYQF
jgi:hypothetical protein